MESGRQIFERFTKREREDLTQGRWIAGTMLVMGAAIVWKFPPIGGLFLAAGTLVLITNQAARRAARKELGKIPDMEQFCEQLASPDSREYEDFGLVVTRDYVVKEGRRVEIYRFDEMEKFEVGLAGGKLKKLFLTDPQGKRHEIAITLTGDGRQASFDSLYEDVRSRLPSRDRN